MSVEKPGAVKSSFEQLVSYYMKEIETLGRITTFPFFDDLINDFIKYSGVSKNKKKISRLSKSLIDASNGTRIIDVKTRSSDIWEVFSLAHMSACCELFQGSKIPKAQLNPHDLTSLARKFLMNYESASPEMVLAASNKLHTMDAVRTMYLLRGMRLITKPSSSFYQLAIGAGAGFKDRFSIHTKTKISKQLMESNEFYYFETEQEKPAHIVISDLDKQHESYFSTLNLEEPDSVLAINLGANEVLEDLKKRNIKKRNLITSIRFDHRMIPDVKLFFRLLVPVISDQCDLVMSMGSGDEPEDFQGRINLMNELYTELDKANLRPFLIKLHGPGDLMQQHASLEFGNPMSSTYEVLYCNLQKKQLSKYFN